MVIVKATTDSEAGRMPGPELLAAMGAFNEDLVKAGVMIDGAGLRASSHGARVGFVGDSRPVTKGPFPLTTDLTAGYWVWKVASLEEAIAWARKCPNPHPGHECHVEIRPMYDESDFA
jgi:hypothetical protein